MAQLAATASSRCISKFDFDITPWEDSNFDGRRVAAIRYAHKLAGYGDPPTSSEVVKATVQGIRRTMGSAPVRKSPATADKVVAMTHCS